MQRLEPKKGPPCACLLSAKTSRTGFLNQWQTPQSTKGVLRPGMSHKLQNKARPGQKMPRKMNKLPWENQGRECLHFTKQIVSCGSYTHLRIEKKKKLS